MPALAIPNQNVAQGTTLAAREVTHNDIRFEKLVPVIFIVVLGSIAAFAVGVCIFRRYRKKRAGKA